MIAATGHHEGGHVLRLGLEPLLKPDNETTDREPV